MNDTISKGRWKRLRGIAQEQRGTLTGNALDRTEGKFQKLAGELQEKYGHTREQADKKIERHLKNYDQKYVAQTERARRMNKRKSIS
jgi:uncharacterized protein YjbJ (UPF0337 family)